MPSYEPVAGKHSAVKLGGTSGISLPFQAYGWNGTAGLIDVTGANCAGFRQLEGGLKEGKLTLVGVWDNKRNPFVEPPKFKLGQKVSSITLVVRGAIAATAENAIVSYFDVKSRAAGLVSFIITLNTTWKFEDFSSQAA